MRNILSVLAAWAVVMGASTLWADEAKTETL